MGHKTNRFFALALVLALSPAAAQKLYKWVDEDGNVHYSDQVPPDQVDKARQELNEQGVVVDEVERALSDEELAAREKMTRELEAERLRLEQLRQEDSKLLRMYSSVEEIERSREQQVQAIDRSIEAAQAYINGQSKSLAGLMERAAQAESQGKTVSDALESMIDDVREQIAEQEQFIADRESKKQEILDEYAALIDRYRIVRDRNTG